MGGGKGRGGGEGRGGGVEGKGGKGMGRGGKGRVCTTSEVSTWRGRASEFSLWSFRCMF